MTKFGTSLLNNQIAKLLILAFGLVTSIHYKTTLRQNPLTERSTEEIYLPSVAGLKLLSVGFDQALSHTLWFKTINYFGRELNGIRDYRFLSHYLTLVTTLNPKLSYVYIFGVMILSWENNQPDEALKLLDRAITEFPNDWYYRYLRGFTYLYFVGDYRKAKEDYKIGASLPDAPDMIKKLAAEDLNEVSAKFAAIRMLRGLIMSAPDEQTKKVLEEKLHSLLQSNKKGTS